MIIAIDFDGTLVDHRFPEIGVANPGAIEACKKFIALGANLALWTVRSDAYLVEAIEWCNDNGIIFKYVNNVPEQTSWSNSPKLHADIFIDDAAFGCPLRPGPDENSRPWVNWDIVTPNVIKMIKNRLG